MGEFERFIEAGEEILETMKPQRAPQMLGAWLGCVVLAGAAAAFIAIAVACKQNQILYGISVVCSVVIAVLLLNVIAVQERGYQNSLYCFTTARLIIRGGIFRKTYRIIELERIAGFDYTLTLADKLCGGKTATIIFYLLPNATARRGMRGCDKRAFSHVFEADELYQEILKLRERCKAREEKKRSA